MTKRGTGAYIVLEGTQGTGKTTQITLLSQQLKAQGIPVRIFREPDSQSDLTARTIRRITQDPTYELNTRTEVLLYNAARVQLLEIIRKARAQGIICLVDRNYLATFAHQYYARQDITDYETLEQIVKFAVDDMEPDVTIILDAPIDTIMQRIKDRGQGERFDQVDAAYIARTRDGYLAEAKKRHIPIISADQTPAQVNKEIVKIIKKTLNIGE